MLYSVLFGSGYTYVLLTAFYMTVLAKMTAVSTSWLMLFLTHSLFICYSRSYLICNKRTRETFQEQLCRESAIKAIDSHVGDLGFECQRDLHAEWDIDGVSKGVWLKLLHSHRKYPIFRQETGILGVQFTMLKSCFLLRTFQQPFLCESFSTQWRVAQFLHQPTVGLLLALPQ